MGLEPGSLDHESILSDFSFYTTPLHNKKKENVYLLKHLIFFSSFWSFLEAGDLSFESDTTGTELI